jgi:single-strand DNA-binding protein
MKNQKNKVILTGFAGKDPEITNFESGNKVAKISIAVNESYKKDGELIEKVNWFTLAFWNEKVALVENIVSKGTKFSIEGKLSTSSYESKGEKRTSIEINVFELEVLPKNEESPAEMVDAPADHSGKSKKRKAA